MERVIAALEVEIGMIESHAERLLEMVSALAGEQQCKLPEPNLGTIAPGAE